MSYQPSSFERSPEVVKGKITKESSSKVSVSLATRATKACVSCRKKKTRCFPSDGVSCSRCKSLNYVCSFEEDALSSGRFETLDQTRRWRAPNREVFNVVEKDPSNRLLTMHDDIKKILRIVAENNRSTGIFEQLESLVDFGDIGPTPTAGKTREEHRESMSQTVIPYAHITSPYNILKESPTNSLLPFCVTSLLNPSIPVHEIDIVLLRLISNTEALGLLNVFVENYGKWILIRPGVSTESLLTQYQKELPLLLDVALLLALRSSTNYGLRKKLSNILTKRVSHSVSKRILNYPATDLHFIMTLLLLSLFGYSLSQPDFIIDPWLYSSIGLSHFITAINYNPLFVNASVSVPDASAQFELLTYMRIYDHLVVTHLFACIVSGRACLIDRDRLGKIRAKLDIVYAGTFDGKMTAEIYLCNILYDFFLVQYEPLVLKRTEKRLGQWYFNWNYLLVQPMPQMLDFFYHFYSLLMYYHVNFQSFFGIIHQDLDLEKNEFQLFRNNYELFDSILKNMGQEQVSLMLYSCIRVVCEILTLVSKTNVRDNPDKSEQFEYFSDQIHFASFFTLIAYMRILSSFFASDLMKEGYVNYFNSQGKQINIAGDLMQYMSRDEDLKARKSLLISISKNDFVVYITQIILFITKFQSLSTGDTNNVYFRYSVTLRQSLQELFPKLHYDL